MRLLSLFALVSAFSLAKQPDSIKMLKKSAEDHPLTSSVDVDKLYTQSGAVEIAGTVSAPLYDANADSILSYVAVTLEGGDTALFAVDPYSAGVYVSEDWAKGAGAKLKDVHSKGAKHEIYKIAALPDFNIGEAQFHGVDAFASYTPERAQAGIAGLIGLQTFPELSAALLLSQGELRLGAASEGQAMLGAVSGGARLTYTDLPAELIKDGKDMKWVNGRRPVAVPGKLDGKDVLVTLSSNGHDYAAPGSTSVATRDVLAGKKPGRRAGVVGTYRVELQVGELAPMAVALSEGPSETLTRWHWQVMLEPTDTGTWDVAYDPTSKTLAVAPVKSIARKSYYDQLFAEIEKGLQPDPESEEPLKPADVAGVYGTLADAKSEQGDREGALQNAQKALENDPDSCANHLRVGELMLYDHGRYGEAAAHLKNAAEMYDAWASLKLPERKEIQAEKAKAEKDGGVWTGQTPQPSSCAVAWGRLAHAELAQGHVDAVIALYQDHTDLDYRLPLIAGNAYASVGRVKEAEAAYRQAVRLGGAASPAPNLALAIVQGQGGRIDDATNNFMDAIFNPGNASLPAARAYGAAVASVRGPVMAEAALRNLAEANPDMPQLQLAYAERLVAEGKDASAPIAAALAGYEKALVLNRGDSALRAGYAASLRLAGKAGEAATAAQAALKSNPSQGLAMLVLADLANDAGDAAKATEWRTKAAQTDADIPTMAPLLATR